MHEEVKNYYGTVLKGNKDLKTGACCTDTAIPDYIKSTLSLIHDDITSRYYGCGLVAPQELEGKRILDLGCGTGRDCYLLSYIAGEDGLVVGVDMTDEQLEIAEKHMDYQMNRFRFKKPNVKFVKGYIEKLDELGFEDNYFDVIISNCVINLSPDKESVFQGAYRLLKPGGEIYFSDVYSDRRVPDDLSKDPLLYGECLGGALYWNDFLRIAKQCGFTDPRLVEDRPLTIDNPEIEKKLGHINFTSATYRLFKIDELETNCEDYGQAVVYRGTMDNHPQFMALDKHHIFPKGKVEPVCGNTWLMLCESRFKEHFDFIGNWDTHYGIFKGCGTDIPFEGSGEKADTGDGSGDTGSCVSCC